MFPLQDETKLIEIELLAPLIIRNSQSGNNTLYRHHHNARLSHGSILAAEATASRAVIGSSSCRMTGKPEVNFSIADKRASGKRQQNLGPFHLVSPSAPLNGTCSAVRCCTQATTRSIKPGADFHQK